MRHLKVFEDFNTGEEVRMVKLIDNNGVVVDKPGKAIEGWGIFDDEGNEYMAGVSDEDNTIYVSVATTDGTLNNEGDEFDIIVGSQYDGRDKYLKK